VKTALVHSYVTMDRWAFQQLEGAKLDEICQKVKQRLRDEGGYEAFEALRQTPGIEEREILWFLAGCEGAPGFGPRVRLEPRDTKAKKQNKGISRVSPTAQLFGRSAEQLKRNLSRIREAASIIENIQSSPFGPLGATTIGSIFSTPDALREYASLIEAAQSDFGQGTEWFLNVAKARLVIHVTHWTGDSHDKEVSAIIAAMTGNESYGQENQKTWRRKYNYLVGDTQLDPYTTRSSAEREQVKRVQNESFEDSGVKDAVATLIKGYSAISQSRYPSKK
jgi:hypothetical protein